MAKCVICSKELTKCDKRQKTCGSPECQAKLKAQWFEEYRANRRVKNPLKPCKFCGEDFMPWGRRTEHCGEPQCRTKFQTQQTKAARHRKRDAQPPKPQRWCEFCETWYTPKKSDQKTCGKQECQEKMWGRNRKTLYIANKADLNKKSREYYARQAALAWRPDDWTDKPELYRIVGGLLLSYSGQLSNEEICTILDAMKLPCPYGKSWVDAREEAGCLKTFHRIRTWIRRPGKTVSLDTSKIS